MRISPVNHPPTRCDWVDLSKPDYVLYHDQDWGVPIFDDQLLFEYLTLESAQAGLSWYTVLKKREHYRKAFSGFAPEAVARFTPHRIDKMMQNVGLIRNRKKLEAAVNNAAKFLDVQAEHTTFARYIWQFVEGRPLIQHFRNHQDIPATSKQSDAMSKDLKRRGFKFVGSTICYAHMQATGMVMDHVIGCFRYEQIIAEHSQRSCP